MRSIKRALVDKFDAFEGLRTYASAVLMTPFDLSNQTHVSYLSKTLRSLCMRSLGVFVNQVEGLGVESEAYVEAHIDALANSLRLWSALSMTGSLTASEVAHFTAMFWQIYATSVSTLQLLPSNSVVFRSSMGSLAAMSKIISGRPFTALLPVRDIEEMATFWSRDTHVVMSTFVREHLIASDDTGHSHEASPHMQFLGLNNLKLLQRLDMRMF
jgi:hypothetical protein